MNALHGDKNPSRPFLSMPRLCFEAEESAAGTNACTRRYTGLWDTLRVAVTETPSRSDEWIGRQQVSPASIVLLLQGLCGNFRNQFVATTLNAFLYLCVPWCLDCCSHWLPAW